MTRKTTGSRMKRAVKGIYEWCRTNRHAKVTEQHETLKLKVTGHYGYYGISGNYRSLWRFYRQVERVWQKWLNRRSQRRRMDWDRFTLLLKRYALPPPKVVHSAVRLAANP